MTTTSSEIPDTTGMTFEKVWFVLQENAKQIREKNEQIDKELGEIRNFVRQLSEQQKQTDEQIKQLSEQQKQTDKQIKQLSEQQKQTDEQIKQLSEQQKQTDKQIKRTTAQLGKLGNRFGEVEEFLVAPGLAEKFNAFNYHFSEAARNIKITDRNTQKVMAEIDVMLENDDFILCVEVKVTPDKEDLQNHIERLKIVQQYFKDRRPKEKKIIGAIAGTVFDHELRNIVIANGLYAIMPSGNTFKIDVPEGFQPQFFREEE
jgi:uncharacterized coiled-coil DUF342 family protein